MIKREPDRLTTVAELAVVDQIALGGLYIPLDHHVDAKRMAVHPPALMPLRERRQPVRRLEPKRFDEPHVHQRG